MKGKSTKWYNYKSLRFSKGAIIHPKGCLLRPAELFTLAGGNKR